VNASPTKDITAGARRHRENYQGTDETFRKMAVKIREAARDPKTLPAFQQFAEAIIRNAGYTSRDSRVTNEIAAQVFLNYIRSKVRYRPDPPMVEFVKGAHITLCVPGAAACIPVGDCFPEGTLLLRGDYEFVPVEQIKVGDLIWGRDKWTRVEATAFRGRLAVDAIEMNNGSTMYLTPGHKVYAGRCKHGKGAECPTCPATARQVTFDRIRVSDLVEDDTLLRPEKIDFGSERHDPDRAYVEGLALADGWVRDNLKCFFIAGKDGHRKEKQKHEVKAICDKLGIETRWHKRYIVVYDEGWAQPIALLGSRARFKHLGSLDLTRESAKAFLNGLMADSAANTKGPSRTFSTTSHKLAMQVRVLHRMFGTSMGWRMLTPEQRGGAGKHPLWRLDQRLTGGSKREWALSVRSIERAVRKVPCWDIQTEDHYVYLPEHDVTVSNCDDLVVAYCSLCMAYGIEARVTVQDFGEELDLHVIAEVKDSKGNWRAADPSHNEAPVGQRQQAEKEWHFDPLDDAEKLGLPKSAPVAEFVSVGSLPNGGIARMVGAADENWSIVTPSTDGSSPVMAGYRYKIVCVTPTQKPSAGNQVVFLPPPFPPIIWPGTGTGEWTSSDTTMLFTSAGWLVETATEGASPGAWTVVGVPTSDQSLSSSTQVTYVQVLQQQGPGAQPATPPNTMPAAAAQLSAGAVLALTGVIAVVVGGGIYAATRYHQNGWGAPAHRRLSAREAGKKLSRNARRGVGHAREMGKLK
jgi:hypothetical protein